MTLSRVDLTYDSLKQAFFKPVNSSFDIGFLGKTRPDLSGIFDLTLLNEVLKEKGLQPIGETNVSGNARSNATTTTK